jgi:hypothetical protein
MLGKHRKPHQQQVRVSAIMALRTCDQDVVSVDMQGADDVHYRVTPQAGVGTFCVTELITRSHLLVCLSKVRLGDKR